MLLSISSFIIHFSFLVVFWFQARQHKNLAVNSKHWILILVIALVNLLLSIQHSLNDGQLLIGLESFLLFGIAFSWFLAVLLTASTANAALLILTCCFNMMMLLLANTLPEKAFVSLAPDQAFHVLLSICAYGLVSITATYSVLLLLNEYFLHESKNFALAKLLPSLIKTEQAIVLLSVASWVGLSAVLINGFFILEDLFAQKVAHKTVLTTLSWALFSWILFLRFSKGLRGQYFCLLIISAFVLLMVGFMGSKYILDYLVTAA